MTKDYKRYGKTGQFRKPLIGDATGALRRQAEQVGESLRKSQIRTDEYGRDYVRGLEKTHSNLLNNFETNKQLTDAIFKTREWATALKGKREVEYLTSVADEYGKKAAYWEDFSTTQFHKYWKAATYIYDEVEKRKQAKQIREDEQSGDSTDKQANLVETITSAANQEEKRLTQEAIRTQRLGEYTATKYTTGLARRKLQPIIADNLANRIIADKGIQHKFESRLEEETKHTTNPLILNSDTVYGLYVDNAYRILKETGIKETSPAGQKILNHWFELGGNKKRRLYSQEQVGIGQKNVLDAFTDFKNNTDSTRKPQLLENLVTNVMTAWEYDREQDQFITHEDKRNRHTDGWIPTFEYLIDNDYYAGDNGEQRLLEDFKHIVWDENGPTGVTFGEKFTKQETREGLLKYLKNSTDGKLKEIEHSRGIKENDVIIEMHAYLRENPINNRAEEDKFWQLYGQGYADTSEIKKEARKILSYSTDHASKHMTHTALKDAYAEGDFLEFSLHYYTLDKRERSLYSHMFKSLEGLERALPGGGTFDYLGKRSGETLKSIWNAKKNRTAANSNIPHGTVKYAQIALQQSYIQHWTNLEGKLEGQARLNEAIRLAELPFIEEKGIGEIIRGNEEGTGGKVIFKAFQVERTPVQQYSSEELLEQLNEGTSQAFYNIVDSPERKAKTKYTVPLPGDTDKARNIALENLLQDEALVSEDSLSTIYQGVLYGTDQVNIPKNLSILAEHFGMNDYGRELLNTVLKTRGYTTSDNFIPAGPEDIIKRLYPKKLSGLSPRHFKKALTVLVPERS